MESLRIPSPELLLGRRTLIVGKVRSGKTMITAQILSGILSLVREEEVTVIDLAPDRGGLGARLTRYLRLPGGCRYLRPEGLHAPRLEGRDSEEVLRLAELNERIIRPLLLNFLREPTEVLVINDLTIYLHAGELALLLDCVNSSRTFLGNAHYGRDFDDRGSGLNERERRLVEELMREADVIIKLSP